MNTIKSNILFIFLFLISTFSFSQSKSDCDYLDEKINDLKPLVVDILYESNDVLRGNKAERYAISSIEELKLFMDDVGLPPSLKNKIIELETKIVALKSDVKIIAIYQNCYTDKDWNEKMLVEYEELWNEILPNIDEDNKAIFKNMLIDNPRYLYNVKYKN